jgi:ElaB/YqjD/DUF883 family membrane-anchored ribosome-binding protein
MDFSDGGGGGRRRALPSRARRTEMAIRPLTILLPGALALSLVACDSRDYEAEMAEMETQLGQSNTALEEMREANQTLQTELEGLRAQSEEATAGAGNLSEEAAETVRSELESALFTATQTVDRLAALERDPEAPAETRTEAVGVLREDVQGIVESVQTAAAELGLELQAAVEPAAGAAPEQEAQPATGGQEPQAEEPAEEQPADEETQPQQ